MRFVVLHGRRPVGDDETMIGARSAKVLHVGIGDTIRSDNGGPTLRIVGIGLMTQTPHSTFDEGALMSMKTVDAASGMTFDQREGALLLQPGARHEGVDPAGRAGQGRRRRHPTRTRWPT